MSISRESYMLLSSFPAYAAVDSRRLPDAAHSVELLRSSKPDNKGQGGLALTVVEYHVYPGMGHTFCGDEMDHIEGFIRRTVPR